MEPNFLFATSASLTKPFMALLLFLCRRKGKKCLAFGCFDDKLILAPTRLSQGPLPKKPGPPTCVRKLSAVGPSRFFSACLNRMRDLLILRKGESGSAHPPLLKSFKETALMTHSTPNQPAFYGLDVHQDTISIARCTADTKTSEYLTTIKNDPAEIAAFFNKELRTYPWIQSAYEAGACGYAIHHQLLSLGIDSLVVAPSKIPTTRSRGQKNDKLDSMHLAKCLHNQDLVAIHVPDQDQCDMRALTRQRQTWVGMLKQAKNRVAGHLRNKTNERFTEGKKAWTYKYWRWLETIELSTPTETRVLKRYIQNVKDLMHDIEDIDKEISALQEHWNNREVVRGLTAIRGIGDYTAAALVGEIGSFSRFETAAQFMSYIGLVPNMFSSGERKPGGGVDRKKLLQGGITKAGNDRVRWLLVEAAWHARHFPKKDPYRKRWEGLPKSVVDHAWKAQKRLFSKFQSLSLKRKPSPVVNIAVARELAGFIWSIGCQMERATNPQLKTA